jgi:hypothetical protein
MPERHLWPLPFDHVGGGQYLPRQTAFWRAAGRSNNVSVFPPLPE